MALDNAATDVSASGARAEPLQLTSDETIDKNCERILERVSPSQVEAFELCQRRWYNDSIRGMREPLLPGSAAERGVHIAEEVEHYGKTGEVKPDARFKPMVDAVLEHLSPPGPTVHVEEWVEMWTGLGLPKLRGRLDWFDEAQRQWAEGHPRAPLLADVKSRSDFRYAKTPVELASDLQLNSYAVPLMEAGGFEHIALRHAYTRTRGKPKGMAVTVTLSREELQPRWLKTVESIKKMTHWAHMRPRTADPLPPNPEACGKFPPHGCPHRALCGFDGFKHTNRSETKMPETNGSPPQSDLMKRLAQRTLELQQKNAGGPVGAPAAAQTPPTGTGAAAPAREAINCSQCDEELTPQNVSRLKDGRIIHIGCPAVEAEAAEVQETGPAVVAPDAPPRTNQPAEAAPAVAEEPKAKRAPRAKKVDPAQSELPAADQAVVERVTAQVKQQIAASPELTTGPIVYVNCVPTKGAHKGLGVLFEEWLAPICEELCQEKGVVDYRLIQYTAKGDLAAKVRKYMPTCPPVVLVSKFSPSADVFLESVIPWASQIIQGV